MAWQPWPINLDIDLLLSRVTIKIRQFSTFCVLPLLPDPVPSKLRKSDLASPGNGSGVRLMLVVRSETPGEAQ